MSPLGECKNRHPLRANFVNPRMGLGKLSKKHSWWKSTHQFVLDLVHSIPRAFLALAGLVLLVVLIIWSWRDVSTGLGSGIARKLKQRKKRWALRIVIYFYAWVFVIILLEQYCGGIVCKHVNGTSLSAVGTTVGPDSTSGAPVIKGAVAGLTSILPWDWFIPVSVVLFVACALVMGRSLIVSFRETRQQAGDEIREAQRQGSAAVQEAIIIVSATDRSDPRIRIVRCFERLVETASQLGTVMSPDQTAREIEMSIRRTFLLQGPTTSGLTQLFEEARYSLHPISEEDASKARDYLIEIADELIPNSREVATDLRRQGPIDEVAGPV